MGWSIRNEYYSNITMFSVILHYIPPYVIRGSVIIPSNKGEA